MRIAIVHNRPDFSYYDTAGEQQAVRGVMTEVSAVRKALLNLGHTVNVVPLSPPADKVRERLAVLNADLVFNLFEGFTGHPRTEPVVPEILSELRILFTGCPAKALKLALNKAETSAFLSANGIPTPAFQVLGPANLKSFKLHYPCIVKPNAEDASHGLSEESVVYEHAALKRQVTKVTSRYGEALVEEFIDGREFNATVMGNAETRVLAISEIAFKLPARLPRILTYAGKWDTDSEYYRKTTPVCPAVIPESLACLIKQTARQAYSLIGCRGYARVDMRMDNKRGLKIIEVNPNPDISPDSGAALHASKAGMDYDGFIGEIVRLALEAS